MNNIVKNNKYLLFLFFLTSLFSCNDFLEIDPEEQNTIQEQFTTRENALEAIAGVYDIINRTFFTKLFAYYGDLQVGNLAYTPGIGTTNEGEISVSILQNIYDFNDDKTASEFLAIYSGIYQGINAANLVLENIGSTPGFTDTELTQIRSECLAARGFFHFYLARNYAQSFAFDNTGSNIGVVYNTRTLDVGVDFPSRLALSETFDLIEADLNEALSTATGNPILSIDDKNIFNATTIRTILADVALWKRDYTRVVELTNEIISSSGIALTTTNYVSEWQAQEDISEAIYVLPVSKDIDENNVETISFSMTQVWGAVSAESFSECSGSGDLISLYDTNDIRLTGLINIQEINTLINGIQVPTDYYFTNKYITQKGMVIYRMSEVYLMRAEANNQLGNTAQALQDLNIIRNRAGLTDITSSLNLEEEIILEKRREFAFENKSFYDYSRTGRSISRNLDCIAATCNLDYPDFRYILPIPQATINVNSNIQQNEGY